MGPQKLKKQLSKHKIDKMGISIWLPGKMSCTGTQIEQLKLNKLFLRGCIKFSKFVNSRKQHFTTNWTIATQQTIPTWLH